MPNWREFALPLGVGAGAAGLLGLLILASRVGKQPQAGVGTKGELPQEGLPPTFQLPFQPPHRMDVPSSLGSGVLTFGNRQVRVPVPVNRSLRFNIGDPGTTARRHQVDLGVIHWSGGEPRDGSGVYNTLRNRGLSAHYIIDRSGTIWECADPTTTVCAHAGSAYNARSWGVEVVDKGDLDPGEELPRSARGRQIYEGVVQGERLRMADFLPAQYTALFALANACAQTLGVPRVVRGAPWRRTAGVTSFRGVVGHMQISPYKPDPGPRPLERLGAQPGWRMS